MMCWRASSSALISSTVLLFLLHCGTNIVEGVAATEYTDRFQECPPENETCTYYFKVQEKLTMILKKDLVYADKGKLYKFDESPTDANVTDVRSFFCVGISVYASTSEFNLIYSVTGIKRNTLSNRS